MGSTPVARPTLFGRPPRAVRFWLAFVIVAVALAVAILVASLKGGPGTTLVGAVEEFQPGVPVHLDQNKVWVVRGAGREFFAFSDDDPSTPGERDCRVEWNGQLVVEGVRGAFETCTGYLFHPGGRFFSGWGAPVTWYPAEVQGSQVRVDFDQPYCNGRNVFDGPCPPRDDSLEPVNARPVE